MHSAFRFAATRWARLFCAVMAFSLSRVAAAEPPPSAPSPTPGTSPAPLPPSPLLDGSAPPSPSPAASAQVQAQPAPAVESPPPVESPEPVYDEAAVRRRLGGAFTRGSVRLTLLLGTGQTVTDDYFILGGGLGYFVVSGLELGVDYEAWLLGSPVMHRLSPETRYVFYMLPMIKPYLGFFYRHTFIKDQKDFDYLGGRIGLFVAPERSRAFFGGGAVYEHMLKCTSSEFIDCDQWYPEVSIGVTF